MAQFRAQGAFFGSQVDKYRRETQRVTMALAMTPLRRCCRCGDRKPLAGGTHSRRNTRFICADCRTPAQ